MFLTAYYALRNHFLQRPGEQFSLQQAHELWNAPWPELEHPIHLTEKALEALEREGVLRRTEGATQWLAKNFFLGAGQKA